MRELLLSLVAIALPSASFAADLNVTVKDARGAVVSNAVVSALPEGRKFPLAKKTVVMDQVNRMFVPHVLPIQTGTAVNFPNSDDISHQVYSFSTARTFQLPLYKGTPANPIVFDKPGVVTLGCNIHDRMSAYIVVIDTPNFALTPTTGSVELRNLSDGKYLVSVWHPKLGETSPASVSLDGSGQKALTLVLGKEPRGNGRP